MNKKYKKHWLAINFVLTVCLMGNAQSLWVSKFDMTSIDCESNEVCYAIQLKGANPDPWLLGDQNYRLFFDAGKVSVKSITSMLPNEIYGSVVTDEILEITGQGQEDFSPLDNIDENLGFVDFNIVASKNDLENAVKISTEGFTSVSEICFDVDPEMMEVGGVENSMNLYFSRPETAGQITQQFMIISQLDDINHTSSTTPTAFLDLTYQNSSMADLAVVCAMTTSTSDLVVDNDLVISPNPYANGSALTYTSSLAKRMKHNVVIFDVQNRVVASYKDLAQGNNQIELIEEIAAGLYLFEVTTTEGRQVKELVVFNK